MDDPGASGKQGTPLRLAPCTGGGSQHVLQFGSELIFFPGQIGVGCVDAPHPTAGTRLILGTAACPAAPGPAPAGLRWALPAAAMVLAFDGKCLTDPPGGSGFTGRAIQSGCDGTDTQNLTLQPTSSTFGGLAAYQVFPPNQVSCLSARAGGTASGTEADWEVCAAAKAQPLSPSQLWIPKNGTLVNAKSGKCLDDPGSSKANGTSWTSRPAPAARASAGQCRPLRSPPSFPVLACPPRGRRPRAPAPSG